MVFFIYVDWTLEETPRPFCIDKGKRRRNQDSVSDIINYKTWKSV